MKEPLAYQSYPTTRRAGLPGCCITLDVVGTGERLNFPDLESLFTFLRSEEEQLTQPEASSSDELIDQQVH